WRLVILRRSLTFRELLPFPTRRSSDLPSAPPFSQACRHCTSDTPDGPKIRSAAAQFPLCAAIFAGAPPLRLMMPSIRSRSFSKRSEEHTSELQSPDHLLCRLLLAKENH